MGKLTNDILNFYVYLVIQHQKLLKNLLFILLQEELPESFKVLKVLIVIVVIAVICICLYYIVRYLETIYVRLYKKPYFVHFYWETKKLSPSQKQFLSTNTFYNKLVPKRQRYFEHRICCFIEEIDFIGREGQIIDDGVKMQFSILYIKLTFGMRHYMLDYLNKIIIYPTTFYSVMNRTNNNGEFTPAFKSLVISWEHFLSGISVSDGVNLGIHEITHAIHFNATQKSDISSEIFHDTFMELEAYLINIDIQKKIVESKLLREYAYRDQFEFIAVLIEVFIESPTELKIQFPKLYGLVKQMLNYRFDGY